MANFDKIMSLPQKLKMNDYEAMRYKNNLKKAEQLINGNKALFEKYTLFLAKEEARPQTITTWQRRIIFFNKVLGKSLSKANKNDAERLCEALKSGYSENTSARLKSDYKTLRKFLTGEDYFPLDVSWIVGKKLFNPKKAEEKTPEDLPTEEEKDALFNKCMNDRDKAIFSLLRETGLRPKEILSLDRRNITFEDEDVSMITVPSRTKTGVRYVPFEVSKPYLLQWLSVHPLRSEGNYPLFVHLARNQGHRLTYKGLEGLFTLLKERAGINKKITPYSLRFSSITLKAKEGWSDQELKAYHGHKPNSKMLGVYVKMSGRDLKRRVAISTGKRSPDEIAKPTYYVVDCPKCHAANTNKDEICSKCGAILNLAKAQMVVERKVNEVDNLRKEIEELKQAVKFSDPVVERTAKKGSINSRLLKETIKEMIREGEITL